MIELAQFSFAQFSTAQFSPVCGNLNEMVQAITGQYGEVPVLKLNGDSLIIWYNPETGTATVTVQPDPDTLCVIASGTTERHKPGNPV
jgi:hypothetical protein